MNKSDQTTTVCISGDIDYFELETVEGCLEPLFHILREYGVTMTIPITAKAVEDYFNLHHFVLEDFLAHNMVDDDQTIAVECFLRWPSLFNMVPGEWYDVFKLFH